MKKITGLFLVLILNVYGFAESFLNFSVPVAFGLHGQHSCSSESSDNTSEFLFGYGVTAEVFQTFSDSFGLGIKGGIRWEDNATVDIDGFDDPECDLFGWYVAPSFGWASNSSSTKKKINIYPFIYEKLTYSDGKINNKRPGLKDFVVTNYKQGASFSWQWGEQKVQNGFEIGFDFDWSSLIEYDGRKIGDDGSGFDFWIGYKLSFMQQ